MIHPYKKKNDSLKTEILAWIFADTSPNFGRATTKLMHYAQLGTTPNRIIVQGLCGSLNIFS